MHRRALLAGASVFLGAAMEPRRVAVLGNNGPSLDLSFINGAPLDGRITFTRASSATDGLYTDATDSGFNSFAVNVPRISTSNGILLEEQRTNSLKNSGTPATQTTASLATGTYTLWVIGTGSAASSAGTATGSGFGAATAGSPNAFTLTGAGTVTVTVSGSLTRFQLEKGSFATSYIPTIGSAATRALDVASIPVGAWFNSNSSTMVVEAMFPSGPVNASQQYLAEISDGTTNNRFRIIRNITSNGLAAAIVVGGTTLANIVPGSATPGAVFKVGLATGAAGSITALGGVAGSSSVTAAQALTAVTTLAIGRQVISSLSQANGYIRRIRYWPRALGQAELNQVTL